MDYEKNAKNLFGPKKANFGQFLAKMGKMEFFSKKAHRTFFSHLQAETYYKISEKSNERISRNRVTDGQTDAHAEANP